MVESKLPNTPHELIDLALADLRACRADDAFHIDMGKWIDFDPEDPSDVCTVCLAGSVMAKTFGISREEVESCPLVETDATPWELFEAGYISREDMRKLTDLDDIRCGEWQGAVLFRFLRGPELVEKREELKILMRDRFRNPPRYNTDPEGFIGYLTAASAFLRKWWEENMEGTTT